jgi:hypothetical protein
MSIERRASGTAGQYRDAHESLCAARDAPDPHPLSL